MTSPMSRLHELAARLVTLQADADQAWDPDAPPFDSQQTGRDLDAAVVEAKDLLALPGRRDILRPLNRVFREIGERPADAEAAATWQTRATRNLVAELLRRAREEWESTTRPFASTRARQLRGDRPRQHRLARARRAGEDERRRVEQVDVHGVAEAVGVDTEPYTPDRDLVGDVHVRAAA